MTIDRRTLFSRRALLGTLALGTAAIPILGGARGVLPHSRIRPEALEVLKTMGNLPIAQNPNFLYILSDDQRWDDFQYMANMRDVRSVGMNFAHNYTAWATCGPSRAAQLLGLLPHTTGIKDNGGEDATAYLEYKSWWDKSIAVALQNKGYYTRHDGKFLNGYGDNGLDETVIPPGYNEWHAIVASFENFWNFHLNDDGVVNAYSNVYSTDLFSARTVDFIQRRQNSGQPWACYTWHNSCHGPDTPDTQDVGTVSPDSFVAPPSFNVDIANDRGRIPLTDNQIVAIKQQWALRVENLQALDRAIADAVNALYETNQLENTYIIITSDNGLMLGEHRIDIAKGLPYPESARVPLTILGPGVSSAGIGVPVYNVDLTATIIELSGATMTQQLDGQSLVPFFDDSAPTGWRTVVLVEGRYASAIYTQNYFYSVWNNRPVELFDSRDTYQMNNCAGMPAYAAIQTQCEQARTMLAACGGAGCNYTLRFPKPPA